MVDWQALFAPHAVVENVIRASAVYLMLFFLLRFLPNRKSGSLGPRDLLVVVLLATAVVRALMLDEASSLTDAAIVVATIVGWSVLLDLLEHRLPFLRPLLRSEAVELVRDGKVDQRRLRAAFMTEEELRSQLRLQGIADLELVHRAYIEHDGQISVIRRDGGAPPATQKRNAV